VEIGKIDGFQSVDIANRVHLSDRVASCAQLVNQLIDMLFPVQAVIKV
jgi:hypothetical protein